MKNFDDISRTLIAFDTESKTSNVDCASFLANFLESYNFRVNLFSDESFGHSKTQIVASLGPDSHDAIDKGLIISGHMDIVPFANQPGWSYEPLKLTQVKDYLVGRGTSDMKVFIAQSLAVLHKIDLKHLKYPLYYLFTCDEELSCQGSKRLIDKLEAQREKLPLPKQALIGEPTNFEVFHAHKGVGHFKLIVKGKAGHSSRPDLGKNAIELMAQIIRIIADENHRYRQIDNATNMSLFPEFPYNSFNVGSIFGGVADNMIPEACTISVSCRASLDISAKEMIHKLKDRLAKELPALDCSIVEAVYVPAMQSTEQTKLHKLLLEVTGTEKSFGAPFATDASFLKKLGMNCYICGPGLLSEAHQPNEKIPLANYYKGLDFIENVIQAHCF